MTDPTQHTATAQRLFYPDEDLDLPFTVINHPGVVIITLHPEAVLDPLLVDVRAYRWIQGVHGRVIVDVSRIQTIDSRCCGWLVNLLRVAKPAVVSISGATERVAATLKMLGLDTLIEIEGSRAS